MAEQIDILDERDPMGLPFAGSFALHLFAAGLVAVYTLWLAHPTENFGSADISGGAVRVSPVSKIPIPQREAEPNPVAGDSQSLVRNAPEKEETQVRRTPKPDAFQVEEKQKKKLDTRDKSPKKYAPLPPENQVFSSTKQAVSNPNYAPPSGGNGVGISQNTVLGSRYGAYAELLRNRITQSWIRAGLDPRSQRDAAVVSVVIEQNGNVRNIQLVQTSGNPAIDDSAIRALYQANPMPPLPDGLRPSFSVEFTFTLK
jgi:protein TonB